ncbi:hypothetical protein CMQ_7337 [Grosmannia clavigera kw1407]|uniref:Heterokaryon incompatibility domain-containing protein n=1 Tax=Grosmannia clavigera (strain kw1407 / UAMH 11150) TaxID=655863 RepID=F0XPA9_GROCL|nr:uncharacterized protein CMQ_7337 [Grosmannia clavigera kw1407]EFX00335.1 hypothetical protein CMQ_7337 [Grosmannia clavigera kw1407]
MEANMPSVIHYSRLPSADHVRFVDIEGARNVDDPVVCRLVTLPLRDSGDFVVVTGLLGDASKLETIILDRSHLTIPANVAHALKHTRNVFHPIIQQKRAHDSASESGSFNKKKEAGSSSMGSGASTSTGSGSVGSGGLAPGWLKSLFRHVADRDRDNGRRRLRVWIDCISLNRTDAAEHARVRTTMYQVYQQAQMVIGWLGLKRPQTDLGIQLIQDFDAAMPKTWQEPGDREAHPENYAPQHQWAVPLLPLGYFNHKHDSVIGCIDLLNRDFFHRRWILEEMAMARVPAFLISNRIVSWKQIVRLNLSMEEFKDYDSDVCPIEMRPRIHEFPLGTIHQLLDEFEKTKAMSKTTSNPQPIVSPLLDSSRSEEMRKRQEPWR